MCSGPVCPFNAVLQQPALQQLAQAGRRSGPTSCLLNGAMVDTDTTQHSVDLTQRLVNLCLAHGLRTRLQGFCRELASA